MSRIFCSLHPFYEGGPIMGRKQANRGFMDALLKKNPFDMYHFFVDNPNSLINMWKEEPAALPLWEKGLLHAFPRSHLERRLRVVPYSVCHFSDPMSEIAAMSRARNAFATKLFPVTAVNHTISYTEYAQSTLGHIWQGCTPRDGIGCTSVASRGIMEAWYEHARVVRNIPEDWHQPQLKMIPLGVPEPDLGDNEELRQQLRQQLQLAPDTVMILLYGRVSVVDKMDVRPFFAALRRIRVKYPQLPFVFVVAGSMEDDDALKEHMPSLAQIWDIPFHLLPNPSRMLKKQLFAAADVFVSPVDNIQETFGLTLVEAAQSALPVIASNWDGYKDIVLHGETGLLVPTMTHTDTPALDSMAGVLFNKIHQLFRSQQTALHIPSLEESLYTLLSRPDMRHQMGEKAKQRAEKLYTFNAVVDAWLDFWEELENTPISEEQKKRFRAVKHPYALDFGKTFAAYASHQVHNSQRLRCTDLGRACVQKEAPWNNYALAAVNLVESLIHKLIEQTIEGCTVEELLMAAHNSTWGKRYSEEVLLTHMYWLLKQDLIECEL